MKDRIKAVILGGIILLGSAVWFPASANPIGCGGDLGCQYEPPL